MTQTAQDDKLRYSRQTAIPEIGPCGQEKLARSRILIVGVGGLGCPAALYLAAAGVGHLGLIDDDQVSLSNLQRQVIYTHADIGKSKVFTARNRLLALNPGIEIDAREERLTDLNVDSVITSYDLVIDGSDNFPTRYVLNDACLRLQKPFVYGAIFRFDGQVSLFLPGGPCYRCLYPVAPESSASLSCEEAGVLGVLPGLVGSIQATEALKFILGLGTALTDRVLMIDSLQMSFDSFQILKRADCRSCGQNPDFSAPRLDLSPSTEIGFGELQARSAQLIVLDLRDPESFEKFHIPGAHLLEASQQTPAQFERNWGLGDELVLYCKSGARSRSLVAELRDRGFTKVRHLAGGFQSGMTLISTKR